MEKTHWKKATDKDPNFVGIHDLANEDGTYRKMIVTVDRTWYGNAKVMGGTKKATVMEFKEVKPLILNVTNKKVCARLFGSNFIEDWHGKQIEIYADPDVKFGGEVTGGIRITPKLPNPPALPALNEAHKHWQFTIDKVKSKEITIEKVKERFSLTAEIEAQIKKYATL